MNDKLFFVNHSSSHHSSFIIHHIILFFSIIIPIYNRPDELRDLLRSLTKQTYTRFEVLVIEDGSTEKAEDVVADFADQLAIRYYFKENSGQGFTRNYGFERAKGEYFVIFDSDALIPPHYFAVVNETLTTHWIDAYGGPDAAHPDFTPIQKAISYSMTSPFTTGGIRGSRKNLGGTYHPRSFNMGLSRTVWETVGGYKLSRMGEDIEFAIRIIQNGFKTGLIPDAFIYHKRRTNFAQFFRQLRFFGRARINIARYYPGRAKTGAHLSGGFYAVYWINSRLGVHQPRSCLGWRWPWWPYAAILILMDATRKENSLQVGLLSIVAAFVQLTGYGIGFMREGWKRLWEPKQFRETGASIEYPS